jgi:hypothetical protein
MFLGELNMNFRLALLLLGVVLLAAMPVPADSLSSSPAAGFEKNQFVASSRADFVLDASKSEALRADPFSSDALRFQAGQLGAESDLDSLKSSGAFFSASSKSDEIRASDFMKLDSYRGGTGEAFKTESQSDGNISSVVPEPETLSLLLLGLAAIGSAALRRR